MRTTTGLRMVCAAYKQKNIDDNLYRRMMGMNMGDGIVRLYDNRDEMTAIYHILDSTLHVCNDSQTQPRHTFAARNSKKIVEAKTKLEEITGVELVP